MTAPPHIAALCSHCLLPIRGQGHDRQVQGEDHRFCCYGCCLAFQVAHGEGEESEAAWLLIRLGIGAFLSMNVMLFSLLLYSGTFEQADAEVRPVVHLLLWALATPCMLILGWPLFQEAWRAAVRRRLTSATLISLGAGTAYAYSALAVVTGAPRSTSTPPRCSWCCTRSAATSRPRGAPGRCATWPRCWPWTGSR